MNREKKILDVIRAKGPLTGAEIMDAVGDDGLLLWRSCRSGKAFAIRTVGYRYLRLDRRIHGYARLSPSILREFLTYSVIGDIEDKVAVDRKAEEVAAHIERVSRAKSETAHSVISALVSQLENDLLIRETVCFIIAGDIVYNMAHDVPRPERSTGRLVKGSDMDMIVVVDDLFPTPLMRRLDGLIYQEKYRLLMTPHIREEIDYVVKNLDRVREQVRFDTFKRMVACKIMHEGTLLYGSERVFHKVKRLLMTHGVIEKLETMEKQARSFREKAEQVLLRENPIKIRAESLDLFYPTEESEEFE